jgi:uncharacterized iron-regulated protein
MFSAVLLLATTLAQVPAAPATQPNPHAALSATYVPERVYDTRRREFTDFEAMLADLARADVALVGEQHDDPNTHRLEAAMLQGLLRRNVALTVSLEMFERDTQSALDSYLAGSMSEEDFLKGSRPWPRYATDYRPLVELARAHQWPVLAANVPRRLAQVVAKSGKDALGGLPETDRPFIAVDLQCPRDDYFTRFVESMGGHPTAGQDANAADATNERYYWSQCLKDETMAESIAASFRRQEGRPGTIVHYNGAFHSDFGLGTAERVRRRLPGRRVVIASMLPVDDIDAVIPSNDDLKRADYLIYTVRLGERKGQK